MRERIAAKLDEVQKDYKALQDHVRELVDNLRRHEGAIVVLREMLKESANGQANGAGPGVPDGWPARGDSLAPAAAGDDTIVSQCPGV